MNQTWRKRLNPLTVLLAALALLFSQATVFAHGGEDHGDQKPAAVSKGTNMIVHVARAGDYEVVIKHAPVEPDKEVVARVFVNRFDTNEPVANLKPVITVTADNGAPVEVSGAATGTPGMYEAKLPPLPKGQYKLAARVDYNGETKTATFSALTVAPQPVTATAAVAAWARTALMVLGILVALGVIGFAAFVIYRASQASRREPITGEAAAA